MVLWYGHNADFFDGWWGNHQPGLVTMQVDGWWFSSSTFLMNYSPTINWSQCRLMVGELLTNHQYWWAKKFCSSIFFINIGGHISSNFHYVHHKSDITVYMSIFCLVFDTFYRILRNADFRLKKGIYFKQPILHQHYVHFSSCFHRVGHILWGKIVYLWQNFRFRMEIRNFWLEMEVKFKVSL